MDEERKRERETSARSEKSEHENLSNECVNDNYFEWCIRNGECKLVMEKHNETPTGVRMSFDRVYFLLSKEGWTMTTTLN